MSTNVEPAYSENFQSQISQTFQSDEEDEQIINQAIDSQLNHLTSQRKKILFIINPASGAGNAINVFERKVVPLLKNSQTQFEVVVTTRQGSAFKFLKNIDIDELYKWSGIVVVSGDGLLFEVFNSLMSRDDWKTVIKMPIGVIPGGSGNGLSYSISHAIGDTKRNQILAAAQNVISGKYSPLDLIRVACDRKTYWAFLSIGWGLLSDIDIESESLRILGGHRFSVWAVVRALGLRKYRGKLKFKLLPGYTRTVRETQEKEFRSRPSSVCSDIQFNESDQVKLINYIIRKEEDFLNRNRKSRFNNEDDDNLIEEIQRILNNDENDVNGKLNDNLNGNLSSNDSNDDSIDSLMNSSCGDECLTNDRNDNNNNTNNNPTGQKTVSSFIDNSIQRGLIESDYKRRDSVNQSNKNNWVTVDGDFVMVYAVSTSHISSDCHFAPGAKLDDGIIWLLYLKGDIGRKEVLKFLISLEKGNHIKLPFVHLVPVSEFTLESNSPKSKFTIDGELVQTNKVHAEMMPALANIMTK